MEKVLSVKLKKSLIGATKTQISVLASLGLRRIGDVSKQPNSPATMGKINKVSHMIEVN